MKRHEETVSKHHYCSDGCPGYIAIQCKSKCNQALHTNQILERKCHDPPGMAKPGLDTTNLPTLPPPYHPTYKILFVLELPHAQMLDQLRHDSFVDWGGLDLPQEIVDRFLNDLA